MINSASDRYFTLPMTQRNEGPSIFLGVLLLIGCHILAITAAALFSGLTNQATLVFVMVFAIGLAQLLYVVPLILWCMKGQQWGLLKGIVIGAVLTALLNGGCYLILFGPR